MATELQVFRYHPVAEGHWYMERYTFIEHRCMETLCVWVWVTADLGCKHILGAQAYDEAVHGEQFRARATELRSSIPAYWWDQRPANLGALDRVFRQLVQAPSLPARLGALYGALKPWLVRSYQTYLREGDATLEGPTLRAVAQALADEQRHIGWANDYLQTLAKTTPGALEEAEAWRLKTERLLAEAESSADDAAPSPEPLYQFAPGDPAVDPRLHLVFYEPGRGPSEDVLFDPQSETEILHIMLHTLVAVETEAAELLCRLLVEFPDLPWTMRFQLCRQMWDECRHSEAQWRILTALGAPLGLYPSIAYINRFVNADPDPLKRLIVLQRVVEGTSLDQHRPRALYFWREGMHPLVQMFDYVLADEDNHIALSHWINELAGDDEVHMAELGRYQIQKEQEFFEFTEWLISKRRDLARLYATPKA